MRGTKPINSERSTPVPSDFGFGADRFKGRFHRSAGVIGEVHGNLRLTGNRQTQRFQLRQAAGGGADAAGDRPGDFHIGGCEIDVKGDQRAARSDRRGARRPDPRRAEIRRAGGIAADRRGQFLELTLADHGKVSPFGARCGLPVEIHRQTELVPDPRCRAAGPARRTLPSRNPSRGINGTTSVGADPRVHAPVRPQVDPGCGARDGGKGGLPQSASGLPANVTTVRLWSGSLLQSRSDRAGDPADGMRELRPPPPAGGLRKNSARIRPANPSWNGLGERKSTAFRGAGGGEGGI